MQRHNITAVFDRDNGDLRLYFDHVEVESLSYTSGSLANGTFYNDAISWTYYTIGVPLILIYKNDNGIYCYAGTD